MSKVTLLDAAGDLDAAADECEVKYAGYLTGKRLRERDNLRAEAALVRAADEVVRAAETLCANAGVIHEDGGQEVHVMLVNTLAETLTAFHKISNGEQP